MQRLIFLIVLSCFFSAQAQKKDTVYIEIRVVTYENEDSFDAKYPKFYKDFLGEGPNWFEVYPYFLKQQNRWLFYDATTVGCYNFWHDVDKHEKKELSEAAYLNLNVLKGEFVRDAIEKVYPGFDDKVGMFYFSEEEQKKRDISAGKNAFEALKKFPKEIDSLERTLISQLPTSSDPTYIPFFHFYLVETTEEGRHFLYEVDCSYEPFGVE